MRLLWTPLGRLAFRQDGTRPERVDCSSCCSGLYYRAVRCDVAHPPIDPTIPANIPREILIRAPFHCGSELCEIGGLRIVSYGGRCYEIVPVTPTAFHESPCQAIRKARLYRLSDFTTPPLIAAPENVVCQSLLATCANSPACLPISGCCLPECTTPAQFNAACHPCGCGEWHQFRLQINFREDEFFRSVSASCPLLITRTVRASLTAVVECRTGLPPSVSVSGSATYTCVNAEPPGNCDGYPYTQQITAMPFTPWNKILGANVTLIGLAYSQGSIGYKVPMPSAANPACSGQEILNLGSEVQTKTWTTTANCAGGVYDFTVTNRYPALGCTSFLGTGHVDWSYTPLLNCENSEQDGDQSRTGLPPPPPRKRKGRNDPLDWSVDSLVHEPGKPREGCQGCKRKR